jgi:hypothetical protein
MNDFSYDTSKGIVLTSDDLGMHPSINDAIISALQDRRICITNIMVPCPWAADAAKVIVSQGLHCGVHVTLTSEWKYVRTKPITAGHGLTRSDGTQWTSHHELVNAAGDEAILAEIHAQIQKAMGWGIKPSHLDIHMIPAGSPTDPDEKHILSLVEEAGQAYGLNCTYSGEGSPQDGRRSRFFTTAISTAEYDFNQINQWLSQLGPGLHHLTLHLADHSEDLYQLSPPGNPWLKEYRDHDQALLYNQLPHLLDNYGFEILYPEDLPEIYRT